MNRILWFLVALATLMFVGLIVTLPTHADDFKTGIFEDQP
jgi:hypothetical protein